ncbi:MULTISPECIES: class I SAM-dependent methyltransferase [Actinosynnema]|uniref:class I SAM-dependent methyltransferase n=1 Tax=Actinosynnema TaxID=40566 RepID=UPI0020A2E6EB|nr:class I SAM-dependent methyltransferase [Actinosynnema pretiosum]MCP2097550.1 N-methyltransferase [Actinosynnema pretiosum]
MTPEPVEAPEPVEMPDKSWTSLGNAGARAQESARADRLFDDPLARAFLDAAGSGNPLLPDRGSGDPGLLGRIADVIVVKTVFFDGALARAAAAGVRQVVLLAAGLDARAFRLAWPEGTVVFEVDLPEVLGFKERVVRSVGARPSCDRRVVAADLRSDWVAALLAAGLDREAPVAWLAEGALGLLDAAGCEALMASVLGASAPGSRFALDHTHDGWKAGEELGQHLEGTGISLDDLVKGGPEEPGGVWLARHGWRVSGTDVVAEAARHGRPAPFLFREADRRASATILFEAELG